MTRIRSKAAIAGGVLAVALSQAAPVWGQQSSAPSTPPSTPQGQPRGAAQSTPQSPQNKGRVVTLSEVTIVGRIQKPIAAVDVSRIQPKLALGELRQPFLRRIEEAIYRAPF